MMDILLDETEYRSWKNQLRNTIINAMQSSPSTREYDAKFEGYRLTSAKNSTNNVFKRKAAAHHQHRRSPFYEILSIGRCGNTLEDIAYTYYNETNAMHRTHSALTYGEKYLDGKILNSTLEKCNEDPFQWFGIKYVKLSFGISFEPRDATYFEYSGTTADREGHKVLFIVRESCTYKSAPSYPGVVRFNFKEWFLFTQLNDYTVETVHFYHADPNGRYPSFLFNKIAIQHSLSVEQIPHICRQKWLLEQSIAVKRTPTPFCGACDTAFKKSNRSNRQQCRACGHAVCAKCIIHATEALSHATSQSIARISFCKKCYIAARYVQPALPTMQTSMKLLDDSVLEDVTKKYPIPHTNHEGGQHLKAKDPRGSNYTSRTTLQSEELLSSSYEPSILSDSEDEDLPASFVKVSQSIEYQKQLMYQIQWHLNQSSATI